MNLFIKIEIIVFIYVLSTNICNAQNNYHPVLGEGFKWYVPVLQMEHSFIDTIFVVKDSEDTGSNAYYAYYSGQMYNQTPELLGKMYESEDKSKLYFCDVDSSESRLIMDLNLDVGDEFITYDRYHLPITLIVSSVYIEDGLKHIKFNREIGCWSPLNLDNDNSHMMFIEGIGPNYGFGNLGSGISPYYFICKHENENLVYAISNGVISGCNFIETNINSKASNIFGLQVSRISENVICLNASGESGILSIYDLNGKLVDMMFIHDNICVDISHYVSGVYVIKFDNNNIIKTEKFIKI